MTGKDLLYVIGNTEDSDLLLADRIYRPRLNVIPGLIAMSAAIIILVLAAGNGYLPRLLKSDDATEEVVPSQSAVLEYLTLEQIVEQSSLIVKGTVTDVSDPFHIIAVFGGDPIPFSDWTIAVDDVLRGDARPGDSIVVRTKGGGENGIAISDIGPVFHLGERVLLCLYHPASGGGYNTPGDYYYIVGVSQGAFFSDREPLLTDDLVDTILDLSPQYVIYDDWSYYFWMEEQRSYLESGYITEEEYYEHMKEATVYATIVE